MAIGFAVLIGTHRAARRWITRLRERLTGARRQ
jgi:hypothetical protein